MNLPPTTVLLIVLIAAVANIVVLLAVFAARHRAERSRQLVDVGGFMSSSYAGDGPDEGRERIPGGWLPPDEASEGWPASRHVWADTAAWPASHEEPQEPASQPFEYPLPTSLEQRSTTVEEVEDVEDAEDAEDAEEVTDWEADDGDAPEEDDEMPEEDAPEMDATTDATRDPDAPDAPDAPALDAGDADVAPTLTALPTPPTRGRDPLTGMLDTASFEEVMEHEEAREQRYGRPATVIVFELDGLAKLVDRLGPEPGDRIETALGDTITRLARRADHVARLARGRYAVLLPETDEVAAINYVERIRRACDLWLESGAIAMRLAIGWASTTGDAGLNGAVRVATDRMRQEMRRNARGVGDVTPDLELVDEEGPQAAEA